MTPATGAKTPVHGHNRYKTCGICFVLRPAITIFALYFLGNMEDINRIKLVLVEKKRTNKWLSEQMGVTPSTVSKWCTNSSQPDLSSLLKIADLLEVDLRELIVREYKSYLLSQENNK